MYRVHSVGKGAVVRNVQIESGGEIKHLSVFTGKSSFSPLSEKHIRLSKNSIQLRRKKKRAFAICDSTSKH